MFLRTAIRFSAVSLWVVTASCATIVTTTKQEAEAPHVEGVTYSLPMKLVKVTLTRRAVATDALKSAAASLEKAKGAAQEAVSRQQASKSAAEVAAKTATELEASKPKTPVAIKAREQADLLAAESVVAEREATGAKQKQVLAEALYENLAASAGARKYEDEISLTEMPAIPDPAHRYVAQLSHWVTHADTLKISTTESGLLKSVSGTSTDKTGAILEDTAKAIIAGIKAAVGLPGVRTESLQRSQSKPCSTLPSFLTKTFSNEYTFNPPDVNNVNCTLEKLGSTFRISATMVPQPKTVSDAASSSPTHPGATGSKTMGLPANEQSVASATPAGSCRCFKGLVYRRPVRWEFSIKQFDLDTHVDVRTQSILLPNNGPVVVASMETSPFIATSYDVAFQDGMLTKWDVDRPSELYAAVQIPLNILKDIIALPTQLLQLKIDYSSKDTDLLKSEKNRVEAATALREAIRTSTYQATSSTNADQ